METFDIFHQPTIYRASQVVIVIKNLPTNSGDTGSIPGSGTYAGGGIDNSFQYSCLERISWTEEPRGLRSTRSQELDMTEVISTYTHRVISMQPSPIWSFSKEFPKLEPSALVLLVNID